MTDENFTINIYTANTKKTKIYSRKISDIISLGEQIEALINLSILEAHNIFKENFMKSYYIKFVVDKETKIFILYKKMVFVKTILYWHLGNFLQKMRWKFSIKMNWLLPLMEKCQKDHA